MGGPFLGPSDLTKDDLDAMAEIQLITYREHQQQFPVYFREHVSLDEIKAEVRTYLPRWRFISERTRFAFGMRDDRQLVGYLLYSIHLIEGEMLQTDGISFFVVDVSVHPKFRGQGVGKDLLTEVVTRARNHAKSSVHASVWSTNKESAALFEGLGFEPAATTYYRLT